MAAHTYNITNAFTGNVHTTLIAAEPEHAAEMFLIRNSSLDTPQAPLFYSRRHAAIINAHDPQSTPLFRVVEVVPRRHEHTSPVR